MKNKIVAMLLAVSLLSAICACGSADTSISNSTAGSSSAHSDQPDNATSSKPTVVSEEETLTAFTQLFENGPIPAQNSNELWGYINSAGEYVIEPKFLSVQPMENGKPALVQDADTQLWGYIDNSGTYVIGPGFSEANKFGENNIASVQDPESGLWGLIDTSGGYIAAPQFTKIGKEFHDELLWARDSSNGLVGFVDETGSYKIAPQFNLAYDFANGYAKISSQRRAIGEGYHHDLLGYINTSGEKVVPDVFEEIYEFSEGLAVVKQGEMYGYIDEAGNYMWDTFLTAATSFSNGVAFAGLLSMETGETCYLLIDKEGNQVSNSLFGGHHAGNGRRAVFSQGLYPVKTLSHTGYIYINTVGETVLPKTGEPYGNAMDFSPDGYAIACAPASDLWGCIDLNGNWVLQPQYLSISAFPFSDGYAEVKPDSSTVQLFDISGNCVQEFHCDETMQVEDSIKRELIRVTLNNGTEPKYQFFYQDGSAMTDQIFDYAEKFAKDYSYAKVKYEGLWGIIDRDANWLIPPKFLSLDTTLAD